MTTEATTDGGAGADMPAGADLPAALDAYTAELMHCQYLVGVLAALGCDVSGPAAAVGGIARRGAELLARRAHQ